MTDAEFRREKRRILRAFNRWSNPTGTNEFIVTHHWHRDGLDSRNPENNYVTQARADVKWEYLTVDFHWNVREIHELPDHVLDRIVRHEIAHVLVNEMREWSCQSDGECKIAHEERVVSKLALVFNWCYNAGRKAAMTGKRGNRDAAGPGCAP